jgi:endo-1,4-beta-mannosidase
MPCVVCCAVADSTHAGCGAQDRRDIAHAAGKPIVLEEYGCCKAQDYQGKRGEVLRAFHDAADTLDYAGLMIWEVCPDLAPLPRHLMSVHVCG